MKNKRWSKKDTQFLKSNYSSMSNKELAIQLERTVRAIEKKASIFGLNKPAQEVNVGTLVRAEKDRMNKQQKDTLLKKLIKDKASTQVVIDILRDVVPAADFTPKPLKVCKSRYRNKKEKAVVLLSDMHIGRYSPELMQKKVNTFYSTIVKMVDTQRSSIPIKDLHIFMLGDIVDGDEIFPAQSYEQKFHLMEQMFTYGLPMVTNLINQLSDHFESITISCVSGNHGRKSKYTAKELNFDSIFYEACKLAMVNNKRVKWNITWEWYQVVEIYGNKFLLIHGNNIRSWLNIPFYGIIQKGMRWQGSLPEDWNYLCMGHFHTNLFFKWNNFKVFMNGTWLDNDSFALRELGMDSSTEQVLFGVAQRKGTTWRYDIKLNGK
jgi:DNA polymerase II small subunit/DNA polymerase delta subunit B|tara:strand:- start:5342 stop:6475 length:1134 start_codon:yes stop_codon:yes gene_type:complete